MATQKDIMVRQRTKLLHSLPPLGEILRGSILERKRRCGKPSCHCAKGPGHPLVYLSVTLRSGKTEQISLSPEVVPAARRWVSNYVRLGKVLEQISEMNRKWLRSKQTFPRGKRSL